MEFDQFSQTVKDRLSDIFGPDFKIEITRVLKNNSVKLTGVMILHKDSCISPTIYLDDYYTDLCDGKEMEEIVNEILRAYDSKRSVEGMDLDILKSFDSSKSRIVFRMVNYEKNLELLSGAPHRRFLDLAVIYVVMLSVKGDFRATVTIKNEHMKKWGVTEQDLWEISKVNTPNLAKATIMSLSELLNEMLGTGEGYEEELPMYVLTNNERQNGASCILYDNVLSDFSCSIGKDVFIIPSSIHEVILLPADGSADTDRLTQIINEVNTTQVSGQEVLSDRLYRYSRNEDRISCV